MYPSWLEWEGLQKSYDIRKHAEDHIISKSLPPGTENVEISRDDLYNINGIIKGKFEDSDELKLLEDESVPLGTFIEPKNLILSDIPAQYDINGFMGHFTYKFEKEFEYEFSAYSVKRKFKNPEKTGWLTEWFLNGPRNPLVFSASTEHELVEKHKRIRKVPESYENLPNNVKTNLTEDNVLFENISGGAFLSFNYSFIEYENEEGDKNYFIIHKVPDELGPKWSNNIGIEYREEWKIPEEEERTKIREIVSFILGRQLLNIGYTKFDKNGNFIEDFVFNNDLPSTINLKSVCESPDETPIKIRPQESESSLETLLKQLIPMYLKLRDELNLNHLFWRYWLARALNFESRLTLLAAGLELLLNSWYKSNNSKSKGIYLPKKDFDNLLKGDFISIEKSLNGQKYKDRIIRRMQGAYQMGVNERIRNFFDEIQLNIGSVEKKALKMRNEPVHGSSSIFGSDKSMELYKLTEAYFVLVNRTILKILGFDGKYIDYYTSDYPERILEEPIINK